LVYGGTSATDNLSDYSYYYGTSTTWPSTSFPGYDTIKFLGMVHDSLHNTAGQASGSTTPVSTFKYQMGATDTFGSNVKIVHIGATASGVLIPPGGVVSMSVSFHNGEHPGLFPIPPGATDTLVGLGGDLYWSVYEPLAFYAATSTGSPVMPNYTENSALLPSNWYGSGSTDWGVGQWKYGGSYNNGDPDYYPIWVFGDPTNPTWQQYFAYDFHVTCPECWVLGVDNVNKNQLSGVKAFPVPANDELNVTYTFAKSTNATISLTNMLGQTVVSQTLTSVTNGTATLNTSSVAAGVYMVSVVSVDGYSNTGRVTVAH